MAELKYVWWLDIWGRIETRLLSTNTRYAVFLVFKFGRAKHGFQRKYMELSVNYEGNENEFVKRVLLDSQDASDEGPREREDGWKEIEMGEFFNEFGDDGSVVCRLFDDMTEKAGLLVEGIGFRPKDNV